jgi:hydrogenase maturation factor
MQKLANRRNVKLSWIFGALICLVVIAPIKTQSEKINNNYDIRKSKYQVLQIRELSLEEVNEREEITYQQTFDDFAISKEHATFFQIQSKGFDKSFSNPVYLTLTVSKDSCQKNAYFPAWKIDKGTSNGAFRMKINFQSKLTNRDLFFCAHDEQNNQMEHLGASSQFRLSK